MPDSRLDRREFCNAAAAGLLGLSTFGLAGCSRLFPSGSMTSGAVDPDAAPPAAVFRNTDVTLALPMDLPAQGNGLHPSLVDFLTEHGKPTWGGYRYWLAWTPYLDFRTELPSIAASNDLVRWVVPNGLPNPITRAFPNDKGVDVRCNDPEICYDAIEDCIRLYHGTYNGGALFNDPEIGEANEGGLFGYRIFADGSIGGRLLQAGPPFTSCCIPGLAGGSVTVHREANGTWHMWEVGFGHRTSTDGTHWSARTPCTLGTPDRYRSTVLPKYARGWLINHAGGKFNPENGRMEFAVAFIPPDRIGGQYENLAMVSCDIADPTAMYVMLDTWLLTPRNEGVDWDGGSLYRSVLMPHPHGGTKRRLIYSAFKSPCTSMLSMPNRISGIVTGDVGAHLLARSLPRR